MGLVWIAPAWNQPRFLYAMALWDVLALAFWAWDLRRLPRPEQLEVRRVWKEPLGLAQKIAGHHRSAQLFARLYLRADE